MQSQISSFLSEQVFPFVASSTGVVIILITIILFLAILVFRSERHLHSLSAPVYESITKQASKRAEEIVEEANENARSVRAEAEQNAGKYLAQQHAQADVVNQQYAKQLQGTALHAQQLIAEYRKTASKATDEVVEHMREKLTATTDNATKHIEQAVKHVDATLSERAESLGASLDGVKERYAEELRAVFSDELTKANTEIDAYRKERFNMVDHQIATLVEKTTQLTLQNKLTAGEHADLVRESLEEAKRQGVFDKVR